MPAGVTWGQYLRFTGSALVAMGLGAQCVHMFYKPMEDFDDYVKEALEKEQAKMKQLTDKSSNSASSETSAGR